MQQVRQDFRYAGFMAKCAEYGFDTGLANELYKIARPIRRVYNAYTGERLGYESAQARPDLQAAAYSAAQQADGEGPPHLYRPLRPVKAEPVPAAIPASVPSATESAPAAPAPKPAPVARPVAKPVVKPKVKPVADDSYKPRGNVFNLVQHGLNSYDDGSIFNL